MTSYSGTACVGGYNSSRANVILGGKYKKYKLELDEKSYSSENGHIKIKCHMGESPFPVWYRVHNVTTGDVSAWFTESSLGANDAAWIDTATTGGNQYTYNVDYSFVPNYGYDNLNIGSVTLDTQPPSGNISAPANNNTTTVALTMNGTDNVGVTSMRFSEDNSNWSGWEDYASQKEYTVAAEGDYTIYVQYRDMMGNVNTGNLSTSFNVDTTAPSGSVGTSSGSNYVGATTQLVLDATDNNMVYQMRISQAEDFSGSAWQNYAGSYLYTVTGADGPKTVYIKFKDAAGNESPVYPLNVTKDTVGPNGCDIELQGKEGIVGETKSQAITIVASGTDANGLYGIEVSSDNSSWSPIRTTKVGDDFQYVGFLLPEGRGTKTVYVRIYDLAGNFTLVSDTILYDEDTTLPTAAMTITSPAGNTVYTLDPNINVKITANDNATYASDLQIRFSNDGLHWSPYQAYSNTLTWNLVTGAGGDDTEGLKTVYLNVKDESGNVAYATATITYSLSKPEVSSGPLADQIANCPDSSLNVSIAEIDGEEVILCTNSIAYVPLPLDSTTKYYRVAVMGSDFGEWTTFTEGNAQKVPLSLGEGFVEVKVQGRNAAGAISDEFILKFLVDHTKPNITSFAGLNGATATKTDQFSITATVDDNLSPEIWARYQVNSGAWSILTLFGNSGDANTITVSGCVSGLNAIVAEFQDLNANATTKTINVFRI